MGRGGRESLGGRPSVVALLVQADAQAAAASSRHAGFRHVRRGHHWDRGSPDPMLLLQLLLLQLMLLKLLVMMVLLQQQLMSIQSSLR